MMKIFVIIVTYNGKEWYDRCFRSLRESTVPVNIIAVDNASTDGSVEHIRQNFPEVTVLPSDKNLGFGQGNNKALRYAIEHDADYVFLLNQDTWLIDNNAIERLVELSQEHPEYGILSPMHLRANMRELGMLWEDGNNLCSKQLVSDLYCGTVKDIYETNYVNAAAWMLPRHTIDTIGGFDPIYQHYEEDDDYLNRTRYHGLKIGVCPSVRIVHDHRKSTVNPFESHSRYHHNQDLLVKLTDLNERRTVSRHLRYFIRKALSSLLTLNFSRLTSYNKDILFVLKNCKRVRQSRLVNAQKSRAWL